MRVLGGGRTPCTKKSGSPGEVRAEMAKKPQKKEKKPTKKK